MPTYKLIYFNFRGLAEPIRFIFAYAGTDYEDHRIPLQLEPDHSFNGDEWAALKPSTPFHTLPYLEVDGESIGQSHAIARLVAKRFGLAGNTDIDQAKVDAIADYLSDARGPLRAWFYEKDEQRKAELESKLFKEQLPEYLSVLEKHLKSNNGGHGFFVGDGPTWADFAVACFIDSLVGPKDELLKAAPLLKEHCERVYNLKGIKEWVAKRPDTPF